MNIIGQERLLSTINHLVADDNFPRYSIICGCTGSGKKLISAYIAKQLDALFVPCELGIDAVRDVIKTSYEQMSPIVYMWADSQKMSIGAKNAILKVTEEPPQNAYFIMTTDNTNWLLGTLLSRGTVFNINPYTKDELNTFATLKIPNISKDNLDILTDISNVPQDILDLSKIDITKFNNVVKIICDNIGKSNIANELKITNMLKLKDKDEEGENEKFDPILFLRACMFRYSELLKQTLNPVYSNLITITSKYLADLYSKSLNKIATVDTWILDMHTIAERSVDK